MAAPQQDGEKRHKDLSAMPFPLALEQHGSMPALPVGSGGDAALKMFPPAPVPPFPYPTGPRETSRAG